MITARPILMSGPMVRSTIEGIKTQTRLCVSPGNIRFLRGGINEPIVKYSPAQQCLDEALSDPRNMRFIDNLLTWDCPDSAYVLAEPKYQVGDLLWCRESIWQASPYPGVLPSGEPDESDRWSSRLVHYAADGEPPNCANRHYGPTGLRNGWFAAPDPYAVWLRRPAIHMPRWASRLTLELTDVRVERLQDISEEDAKAEGLKAITKDGGRTIKYGIPDNDGYPGNDDHGWDWREWCVDPRRAYFTLWDKINGDSAHLANPWVWVLTFKVHHANVDAVLAQRAEVAA